MVQVANHQTEKDRVMSDLVTKKQDLLNSLLTLSIKTVVASAYSDSVLKQRRHLLDDLQRNDRAIMEREKQTGIDSKEQERELYSSIRTILKTIEENNQDSIIKLEKEEQEAETEKIRLGKNKKISNYVTQNKAINRFYDSQIPSKQKNRIGHKSGSIATNPYNTI